MCTVFMAKHAAEGGTTERDFHIYISLRLCISFMHINIRLKRHVIAGFRPLQILRVQISSAIPIQSLLSTSIEPYIFVVPLISCIGSFECCIEKKNFGLLHLQLPLLA